MKLKEMAREAKNVAQNASKLKVETRMALTRPRRLKVIEKMTAVTSNAARKNSAVMGKLLVHAF
jgi:hypothetical protein